MKKLVFLFLSVLLFQSCLGDDDTPKYNYELLTIDEAQTPDSFIYGETYDITVKYSLPNSCYFFNGLYYDYQDTIRVVAINARVRLDVDCTEEIVQEEYTFPVKVTQEKDYVFKFWKGVDDDGENIFEEVVVPVN
ncbi:hypothetical protein C7447_101431 [Tenacibaculum adriaticum]|uniref:Lipoprotein n=1 Tax=Tenacibaculum adriaticum TaxID=413713 RepID=A0A5S5DXP8_9FLAO|nr:hypothetical protein [Tenacibaculum adriaticum]TYP99826.1 hypothetical protein C7447_101431 [Tenacibaculum adriaticum]